MDMIWLTSVDTSEVIGLVRSRIVFVEQKPAKEGHVVAIFLDTGREIRVMEPLSEVRMQLEGEKADL
jgi:hypothetical protein